MRPAWISIPDVVIETITNRRYEAGLRKASLKMIDNARNPGRPVTSNLYDDLYSSFRETGLSETEAEDFTWNVLAVIATAGPNLPYRLKNIDLPGDSMLSKVALSAISITTPLLDQRTFETGKPYSYPKELTTHCNTGKPYHFWMSAYFARRLERQNGDALGSAAAAFILEKGYQMRADEGFRDPSVAFTSPPLSASNNALRIDLAYAAAGARYGADHARYQRQPTAPLDLDQTVRKIISGDSYVQPVGTKQEAERIWEGRGIEGYLRWSRIFSPNTALRSVFAAASQ
jgi:hypothetical protein